MMNEEEENLLDLEPSVSEVTTMTGKIEMMDAPQGNESETKSENEVEKGEEEKFVEDEQNSDDVFQSVSPQLQSKSPMEEIENSVSEYIEDDIPLNRIDLENIGHFCDADVPLIFCARKIILSFLLTKKKGVKTPTSTSRKPAA